MKLSVITDEISQEFERSLDVMLEYDVRHAELRGLWGTKIADLDSSQVSRAKDAMKAPQAAMANATARRSWIGCDGSDASTLVSGELGGTSPGDSLGAGSVITPVLAIRAPHARRATPAHAALHLR